MIRLCIVEDSEPLRKKLCCLFSKTPDIRICGSYVSAEACIRDIRWDGVDVLLTDIELPGSSGVDLIAAVCMNNPGLRAMAFTVYEDRETVFAALRAGALGYLVKGAPFEEVAQAIRQIMQGGSPMSPTVARKLIDEFRGVSAFFFCEPLSIREKHLLRFISEGMLYKEIAVRMNISVHTVHTHITNIYKKLQAKSRNEALRRAASLGYLDK